MPSTLSSGTLSLKFMQRGNQNKTAQNGADASSKASTPQIQSGHMSRESSVSTTQQDTPAHLQQSTEYQRPEEPSYQETNWGGQKIKIETSYMSLPMVMGKTNTFAQSKVNGLASGRRSFGKFNKEIEKPVKNDEESTENKKPVKTKTTNKVPKSISASHGTKGSPSPEPEHSNDSEQELDSDEEEEIVAQALKSPQQQQPTKKKSRQLSSSTAASNSSSSKRQKQATKQDQKSTGFLKPSGYDDAQTSLRQLTKNDDEHKSKSSTSSEPNNPFQDSSKKRRKKKN